MKCLNIFACFKNITYKMPNLIITRNIINTLNYKVIFFLSILFIYFIWMDIALFVHLQKWTPVYNDDAIADAKFYKPNSVTDTDLSTLENKKIKQQLQQNSEPGVFNPLTVKLIMIDHMTHYVHDILAHLFEIKMRFTHYFPWVTPNLVSYTGLALALVASKMILSDKLSHRRLGCVLFELRNFADSFDGVVFRSLAKRGHTYESVRGSFGYNVDIICDGLGGLVFVLAIFIRYLKNPPHKSLTLMPLYSCNNNNNTHNENSSNSNYRNYEYTKLENLNSVDDSSLTININENSYGDDNNNEIFKQKQYSNNNHNNLDSIKINFNNLNNDNSFSEINYKPTSSYSVAHNNNNNQSFFNLHGPITVRHVKFIVIPFGIRLLLTGLIWDHYVNNYQMLLQNYTDNVVHRAMQLKIFKSTSMWLIMWFWRLANGCAIFEHLVFTSFFDKTWDYLVITSYIGWIYLIVLTIFTQLHYSDAADILMRTVALS